MHLLYTVQNASVMHYIGPIHVLSRWFACIFVVVFEEIVYI